MKELGFGCVGLGTQRYLKDALNILEVAYDLGILYFDTAPIYSRGYSEKILGEFQKNKRNNIEIATKFGLGLVKESPMPIALALYLNSLKHNKSNTEFQIPERPLPHPFREIKKKDIEESLASSLKRLKTDYVDSFLLHEGIYDFLSDDAKSFLHKLKADGIVKRIGIATNYVNIKLSSNPDFWDIFQYENGAYFDYTNTLVDEHPNKMHIYHSSLKGLSKMKVDNNISKEELASVLLINQINKNPLGKTLFSTSNAKHLLQNINNLKKIKDLGINQINQIIEYAIS